ncbi:MAG: DUF5654 family protein [Candidatus Micrarchaeota archaeon]
MPVKRHSQFIAEIGGREHERLKRIIEEQKQLNRQIRQQVVIMISSALGLVAALAWNEAIQAFFKQYLSTGDALTGKFLYALFVTVLAVILTYYLGKFTSGNVGKKGK